MTSSIHVIDALLCVALMMGASHLPALMYILSPIFPLLHVSFFYMICSVLISPYYIYYPHLRLLYTSMIYVLFLLLVGLVSFSFLLVC